MLIRPLIENDENTLSTHLVKTIKVVFMGMKILGQGSELAFAAYLYNNGWHLLKFDLGANTAICETERNGRTDEEIDTSAREARVAISMYLTLRTGVLVCPTFKYKVIEEQEGS